MKKIDCIFCDKFSGEKMYSARVVARVLNGGLGICASASIILAENKEQNVPAIQKFTGMNFISSSRICVFPR